MDLNGLCVVNVELTNKCNKKCWMCGRRKLEKKGILMDEKFVEIPVLEKISNQLPENTIVQFHNNGEALLHPEFGNCVRCFNNQIKNVVTNGKLLIDKFDDIVDNLDTMAISVFENDYEADEQFEIVNEFIKKKGNRKPLTIIRVIGNVNIIRYQRLNLLITHRVLHSPFGSFKYRKINPIMPEYGICSDFLHHPSIDVSGNVSICVRFDPNKTGVIGNINDDELKNIWNCEKRKLWLQYHKNGLRNNIPLCSNCEFWGVPND